jgi:(p)ppGpp synthase/HD superfamily hydrolase
MVGLKNKVMETTIIDYKRFRTFCITQHDLVCNQKYATSFIKDGLPYSFHLRAVVEQIYKFKYLLKSESEIALAIAGGWGHDLIEDARVTYNDIKQDWGEELAEVIYRCTEERGRNRNARHSASYYCELAENDIATFVKLCDIIANVKFSLLTNSSMYEKYKKEYPKMKTHLYREQYMDMFEYLERILSVEL